MLENLGQTKARAAHGPLPMLSQSGSTVSFSDVPSQERPPGSRQEALPHFLPSLAWSNACGPNKDTVTVSLNSILDLHDS